MNNKNPRDELRERIDHLHRLKANIIYGLERGLIIGSERTRKKLTAINNELDRLSAMNHDSSE